jgi:predicted enzyme related to lactoylglutathione lyase
VAAQSAARAVEIQISRTRLVWHAAKVGEAKIGLVLDCADPETVAAFWEQALRVKRLGAAGNYVLLGSPSGALPNLLLQRVSEPKAAKNRMHLDIETPDVDAEVERLEGIGAQRLEEQARTEHGSRWVIMVDPENNEFCVCDAGSAR